MQDKVADEMKLTVRGAGQEIKPAIIDPKPMNLKNAVGFGYPEMAGRPRQVSDQ